MKFDLTIEADLENKDEDWNITKAIFFCPDTNDYIEAPRWLLSMLNKSDYIKDYVEEELEKLRNE